MKILSFFIIASFLFFTVSCSEDAYEIPNENAELELRRNNSGDNGGGNGVPMGYAFRVQIGEWTSTECQDFINFENVFEEFVDCICYKDFIKTKYSGANGYCYDIQTDCVSSTRPPDSTCEY